MRKFLIPRLRDILSIAIFLSAVLLGPRMLSIDSDLGRHLTLGQFILDQREIPTVDILSHTKSGEARPPYEWLTQVVFAAANRLAGLDGVVLVCAGIIAAGFAALYNDAARRSQMPLTALLIVILAAGASSLHWLPRPHIATFLLLTLWLERLERVRRGEHVPLWHFPALMLVWVNAHGGFVFGILGWCAYVTGWIWEKTRNAAKEQIGKKLLAAGAASLTTTFLTPSGWGNWQAVLNNNSRYILARTAETMPPDFTQAGTWPFALMLVMSAFVFLATRKTLPAAHLFLLGGFGAMSLLMARNIPLFAIAAAPILSENAAKFMGKFKQWRRIEANIAALESSLRGALWPILFGLGFALAVGVRFQVEKEALTRFDSRLFPVAAADWLFQHPQSGNMFNDINWGGYLLFRLWPAQKVFADSQTDFYGEALVREYEQILTAQEGWQNALERRAIAWAILPPNAPLASALQSAGWRVFYSDTTAIVLRKP